MSLLALRSLLLILLASAAGYQVLANGTLAKSRCAVFGPAAPSTPPLALQGLSGSKLDWMRIVWVLSRKAAQMPAAWLNTLSRCAPSVVPGLPPSGLRAAVELKPSLAPSAFTMVKVLLAGAAGCTLACSIRFQIRAYSAGLMPCRVAASLMSAGGAAGASLAPVSRSRPKNRLASATLVILSPGPSHSRRLPVLIATFPSRNASVRRLAMSKFE